MKRQEISVEKLLGIIEEKDRRIAELEQQVQWFMEQIRLSKRKQFGVILANKQRLSKSIFLIMKRKRLII
ncbi:hypothetical protein ABCY62_03020 [Acetivibrio clariflavus]